MAAVITSPFLPNSSNTNIIGSSIVMQNTVHNGVGAGEGIKALYKHVDPRLFHNSREQGSSPGLCERCKSPLPTKEDKELVTRITSRLLAFSHLKADTISRNVVLCGPPSPHRQWVARRVAEVLEENGRQLGSIFLPPNVKHGDAILYHIISTLAFQIALSIPETRAFIEAVVLNDPSIFDRALDDQVRELIELPLKSAFAATTEEQRASWTVKVLAVHGLDNPIGKEVRRWILNVKKRLPFAFPLFLSVGEGLLSSSLLEKGLETSDLIFSTSCGSQEYPNISVMPAYAELFTTHLSNHRSNDGDTRR